MMNLNASIIRHRQLRAGLVSHEFAESIRTEVQKVFGDKERCAKYIKAFRELIENKAKQ